MLIEERFPLLYKILLNWPNEPERPPLLLNGLKENNWELLREEIIKMFTGKLMPLGHPDILILERDTKKTGVEVKQTREFIAQLTLSGYELPFKLGIIPAAHQLNVQSQNALLKTLEEPLPNRYLIIGTVSKNKLLPTILSRSTIINLEREAPASNNEITALYKQCLDSPLPQRLLIGQTWSGGKTEKINEFFESVIPELHSKLKEHLKKGEIKNVRALTGQLGLALSYSEQLQRTSGASPKLLFESFLLGAD